MPKEKSHKTINLLGLKIKISSKKNLKSLYRQLNKKIDSFNRKFVYLSDNQISKRDKILYLSSMFYELVGYYPNLKNPKTFNEKLNWMKLNYFNPIEEKIVDKYEFKNYIKEKLGEGYTIPLIKMYEDINDINFDALPNQFVVKTTCASANTGVFIVKDKAKLDIDKLKYDLNQTLSMFHSGYCYCYTRNYKDIVPRIIIEEYVEQLDGNLYDYKFYCFHGTPKWVLACYGRDKHTIYENHDLDWNTIVLSPNSSNTNKIKCPATFEKMYAIAKKISQEFPFVRVDFYDVNGKVYIGELTFTPGGGFNTYYQDIDKKIGDWLDLSKIDVSKIEKEV